MRAVTLGLLAVTLAAIPFLAGPDEAQAASLKSRLRDARQDLKAARQELAELRVQLRAAIDADDDAAFRTLRRRYRALQRQLPKLRRRVRRLETLADHPMTPDRNGSWWRVIKAAAARHRIDAGALRRMMMLESSGRADLVAGPFCGLFQYCSGTWNGSWNKYRRYSIFNGGAQIWATAYAVQRGWGPSMWPNAYRMAFGR